MDMETAVCEPHCQNGDVHHEELCPKQPIVLKIHLYHSSRSDANCTPLCYPPGEYVTEQLIIDAAKECGQFCPSCDDRKEAKMYFEFIK